MPIPMPNPATHTENDVTEIVTSASSTRRRLERPRRSAGAGTTANATTASAARTADAPHAMRITGLGVSFAAASPA